ncbi:MAG: hypothetical protein KDC80_25960, partial [Saprospiraceae bacterium]|nr:hypothetical protein [Saprospiraceae bacterium]
MSLKSIFREQFPRAFFLDGKDMISLETYLNSRDRLSDKEKIIAASKPGEGNMNYVLRITTNHRSFIIKQARPWVEKYPQIPAPVERSVVESTFLQKAQEEKELSAFSPKILWSDPDNFILAMEDLGEATDYTFLYKKENKFGTSDLENATKYLKILHGLPIDRFPENAKMRKLNHEHIFDFPFQKKNGLDLDQTQKGLNAVAAPFKTDGFLKNKIQRLGAIYLAQGRCLIHGDFYPGSWLKSPAGI